jgi:hypothetical protein
VKHLSGTGRETQVSTNGGSNVHWRGDGREILYRAPDNRVMSVAVRLPAQGTNVQPGVPIPLFTLPAGADWDVTPDGQRILANVPAGDAAVPPITVVLNWKPGK